MKLVTTIFKSGGLHEKHVVATWNLGNHLIICLYRVSQEEYARIRESVPYTRQKWRLLAVPNTATCTADTSRDSANVLDSVMQCSLCLRDALRSQPCYVTAGLSHV